MSPEELNDLPENIRDILLSNETSEVLDELAFDNGLNESQLSTLAKALVDILTFKTPLSSLSDTLVSMGIKGPTAFKLEQGIEKFILKDVIKDLSRHESGGDQQINYSQKKEDILAEIENPTSHRDLYPFTEPMDELLPAPESAPLIETPEKVAPRVASPEAPIRSVPLTKPKSAITGLESVSNNLSKDTLGNTKPKSYTNDPYREPIE